MTKPGDPPETDERYLRGGDGASTEVVERTFEPALLPEDVVDVEAVSDHELPPQLADLLAEYEQVVDDRSEFLWKWLHLTIPQMQLSCVAADHESTVRDLKLATTFYVVVLDDLVDRHRDRAAFEELAKVPFPEQSASAERAGVEETHLTFAKRAWDGVAAELRASPRYGEFEDVFRFDLRQNVNAIDYSSVSNALCEIGTLAQCERYEAHNMMVYTYLDVDLMYSPSFRLADLSALRSLVGTAQEVIRIGNWLSTWEREVRQGDFSSGVVVSALQDGIVTPDELYEIRADGSRALADGVIERIRASGVEASLFDRLDGKLEVIRAFDRDLESVDVVSYVSGVERVLASQLACEGHK